MGTHGIMGWGTTKTSGFEFKHLLPCSPTFVKKAPLSRKFSKTRSFEPLFSDTLDPFTKPRSSRQGCSNALLTCQAP